MGWNSGVDVYETVALALKSEFGDADEARQISVLQQTIEVLEALDCDVLEEAFGVSSASDFALKLAGYHLYTDTCRELKDGGCTCGWKDDWKYLH